MDVIGLGTLAMDVLIQVDSLPKADAFCIVENTSYLPGGSGTNVIVQLARLGASCGYIGKVGDDSLGRDVLGSLKNERVNTAGMVVSPGGVTLHTDIVVDRTGEKFIMLNAGDTFASLREDEIDWQDVKNAKVLYTDLLPYPVAARGLCIAREAGVGTACNLQAGLDTMAGFGVRAEDILGCLRNVDVFAPCRGGLFELAGTEDVEECRRYIRQHFDGVLLITLGGKGSVAFDREDNRYEIPAHRVRAVDTTGAGDSYMGAFLYSHLLRGDDLPRSMQFATACAAHTCTGLGARYSPTLEQAEAMLLG